MSAAKTSNHDRAPQCAELVQRFRDVFGEVTVLYVEENGLRLGDPTVGVPATVLKVKKNDAQQRTE